MSPPPSAVSSLTGLLGLGGFAIGLIISAGVALPVGWAFLLLVTLTAAPMIVHELIRQGSVSGWRRMRVRIDVTAMFLRLLGAGIIMVPVVGFYQLLPEYRDGRYEPIWQMAMALSPLLAVLALLRFALAPVRDEFGSDPLRHVGAMAVGRRRIVTRAELAEFLRQCGLKLFFIPLMAAFLFGNLVSMLATLRKEQLEHMDWFLLVHGTFYTIDVTFGLIGYLCVWYATGSQIRSSNDGVRAWLVCLVCYPPFFPFLSQRLGFAYKDAPNWLDWFGDRLWLLIPWGCAILFLELVYAWATVIYGLRFSNLTHRGIVTNGPYRFLKHPAYLAKNLSWWLTFVPFALVLGWGTAALQCLQLLTVNALYLARARTEERHLRADPAYRAYEVWIAEHGVIGRARRRLFPRAKVERPDPQTA